RGLLYAGTETGMFVSFNDGAIWRALKLNLPTTPVHDLVVKNDDLVLATHGRSFWILDDVSPLRQFTDQITAQDVHLYTPATAYRFHNPSDEERKSVLAGQNPPPGAVIYYYVKNAPKGETTIEILDSAGAVIRKYSNNRTEPLEEPRNPDDKKPEKQIKAEAGLNRFIWDERYEGTSRVPGYYLFEYKEGAYGPFALPGKYQVRLTVDDETDSAPTEAEYQEFDKLKKQTDDYLAHWAELQKTDLASFQKIMAGQNIQAIVVPTAEATSAGGEEPR